MVYLPGFSPSVPQQLKNTGLFGGEVTKQEVHSVSAEVRGDDGTSQIRTSEGLQHLWTRARGQSRVTLFPFGEN